MNRKANTTVKVYLNAARPLHGSFVSPQAFSENTCRKTAPPGHPHCGDLLAGVMSHADGYNHIVCPYCSAWSKTCHTEQSEFLC